MDGTMNGEKIERLLGNNIGKALERLLETGPGREMLDELEGDRLAERRRLVSDLERIESQGAAELKGVADALAHASSARESANAALRAAEAEEARAREAWHRHTQSQVRARTRILERLNATADRQVSEFVAWLEHERGLCRHPRHLPLADKDDDGQLHHALSRRRAALAEAQSSAAKLRLMALDATETAERIAALREALPPDPGGLRGQLAGGTFLPG
jgi:hypothetical protein